MEGGSGVLSHTDQLTLFSHALYHIHTCRPTPIGLRTQDPPPGTLWLTAQHHLHEVASYLHVAPHLLAHTVCRPTPTGSLPSTISMKLPRLNSLDWAPLRRTSAEGVDEASKSLASELN